MTSGVCSKNKEKKAKRKKKMLKKIDQLGEKKVQRNRKWLLLGVTVHEFMLISICQCLCHIMIVSWSHGFIGLVVSVVS